MSENQRVLYEYASVYLLDNPYCIDTTYDYFIPMDMREQICRGCFVTVPFGRGNRKNMALVWGLSHCPEYSDVKPIDAICHDRPVLDEEMMAICAFMKEQTLCTIGEAVRCVMPSSAIGKMSAVYYPIPSKGPDASSGFSAAELFVYDYVVAGGGRGVESIKARFGAAVAQSALDKLVAKGISRKLAAG